ncbi:MAG: hypothetical protein EBY91_08235, partial [Burkholderiaceae bacterium]|nr:hypothetical protein [Burkholderiaceae bacterium]
IDARDSQCINLREEVVKTMTAHVDTGEPLPRSLFDKMLEAKNFQNGLTTMRQLVFSLTDWRLHSRFDANSAQGQAVLDLARSINNEYHVIPQASISRWPNTFSHIFAGGYAAGYYSYKWAEVLSADVYAAFEEAAKVKGTVLDPETGIRYRQEILEVGGSRPAAESFAAFRGRPPHGCCMNDAIDLTVKLFCQSHCGVGTPTGSHHTDFGIWEACP